MVAIPNIVFGGTRRWLWLGGALAMVVAGASLAEATGGSDPSLPAALAAPAALPSAAAPVAAEPVGAEAAAAEDTRPRAGAEEQRRIFMLLLLNSAGPLRPYSGLSR
jgi:hypothetical protein